MSENQDPQTADVRRAVEEQIAFVLEHPATSAWLKRALRDALDRHPIDVLNDLEILSVLLQRRSRLQISIQAHDGRNGRSA